MMDWERLSLARRSVEALLKMKIVGERLEKEVATLLGLLNRETGKPLGQVKPM